MNGKNGGLSRQDRLIKQKVHDPYKTDINPKEPTVCPECSVVFRGGRWQWQAEIPENGYKEVCPACQRIRDNIPAGILTMTGNFFSEHRQEMLNLITNKVEEQRSQHPMKRLMAIEDKKDGSTIVTFTDTHLPRGVGQAIKRAYDGKLDIHYTEEASIIRVFWER
ncbi:MAG: ATPase [Desulfuromonadales bacterium]|nr:ATPase [Desulfuromonadales bacterium]